jgi:hypothetical protein
MYDLDDIRLGLAFSPTANWSGLSSVPAFFILKERCRPFTFMDAKRMKQIEAYSY